MHSRRVDQDRSFNAAMYAARHLNTKFETMLDGRHFPKAYLVLRFMIDGESWGFGRRIGGEGRAAVNLEGCFGYDASLRRMVRDGLAVYKRGVHHEAARVYSGNPTVNWSFLEVTDKGRAKYVELKKRYEKKR